MKVRNYWKWKRFIITTETVMRLPRVSKCWTNITHIMYIEMENVTGTVILVGANDTWQCCLNFQFQKNKNCTANYEINMKWNRLFLGRAKKGKGYFLCKKAKHKKYCLTLSVCDLTWPQLWKFWAMQNNSRAVMKEGHIHT